MFRFLKTYYFYRIFDTKVTNSSHFTDLQTENTIHEPIATEGIRLYIFQTSLYCYYSRILSHLRQTDSTGCNESGVFQNACRFCISCRLAHNFRKKAHPEYTGPERGNFGWNSPCCPLDHFFSCH